MERARVNIGPLVLVLLFLAGCSSLTDSDERNFIFPLQDGARWEYGGEYAEIRAEGDSMVLDTVYQVTGAVEITRHINLRQWEDVYELHDVIRGRNEPRESFSYYKNQDDGLHLFAYSRGGVGDYFPKPVGSVRYVLNGQQFPSLASLPGGALVSGHMDTPPEDSLFFEVPPVKALAYPLETGRRWIYRESGEPWRIEKEITDFVRITVPAGEYDAYRIRWWYDINDDGRWDENIRIVDFISRIGLIQRTIQISGIEEVSPGGEKLLEILNSEQHFYLTRLDV